MPSYLHTLFQGLRHGFLLFSAEVNLAVIKVIFSVPLSGGHGAQLACTVCVLGASRRCTEVSDSEGEYSSRLGGKWPLGAEHENDT